QRQCCRCPVNAWHRPELTAARMRSAASRFAAAATRRSILRACIASSLLRHAGPAVAEPAPLRLFHTPEHPCGYWPERAARDLVLDPGDPRLGESYARALQWGF